MPVEVSPEAANHPTSDMPLVIDLDGTLIKTDSLVEGYISLLSRNWPSALLAPIWLLRGKAALKEEIFQRVELDPVTLPYNQELLAFLSQEHSHGREIVLATAANHRVAEAVAAHLGLFARVIASTESANLSGSRKAEAIASALGGRAFEYAGNSREDLQVWKLAARIIMVTPDTGVLARARALGKSMREFPARTGFLSAVMKAMRPHQWLKNTLVFVPVLTAHAWTQPGTLASSFLAFAAFSLCASSVYLLNDLFDLASDRVHPRKRNRPIAAGDLGPLSAVLMALLLLITSICVAALVSIQFLAILAVYFAATSLYSLTLKRQTILDVLVLAGLYTLRVVGGVVALKLDQSFWLLAFSMFIFFSLALVKRCAELVSARETGAATGHNRGYQLSDLPLLMNLGTSSGLLSVLVLALFINSEHVRTMYTNAYSLWLLCPLLLCWICRMWLKTSRHQMHDDPLVFAIKDRGSLLIATAMVAVAVAAF
jgi:4-hydroxybenzoate polyprenyltransferase/phosphoserine phosphatase